MRERDRSNTLYLHMAFILKIMYLINQISPISHLDKSELFYLDNAIIRFFQ